MLFLKEKQVSKCFFEEKNKFSSVFLYLCDIKINGNGRSNYLSLKKVVTFRRVKLNWFSKIFFLH